jgi:RNA polymerase sigma-70 factor (ECF subfamily)
MKPDPVITDEVIISLVPRCQRGDAGALEAIYDLYADRIYRYILARVGDPDTAADLTEELFVRAIQAIGRFRLNERRAAASFSAWLYQIAANLVHDFYRDRGRQPEDGLAGSERAAGPGADPPGEVEHQETLARLAQAMAHLTEEQRLVIVAKYGEEMSNAEVAQWLGKTEGSIKALQHRALRTLGRLLG